MKWSENAIRRQGAALIGGRAPVEWQAKVARSTARLNRIQQSVSWVGFWQEAAIFRLLDRSFFAGTLGELVSRDLSANDNQGKVEGRSLARGQDSPGGFMASLSSRGKHQKPGLERQNQKRKDAIRFPRTDGTVGDIRALLRMNRSASRPLLVFYAGDAALDRDQVSACRQMVGDLPLSPKRINTEMVWDEDTRQIWLNHLAKRTGHSLHLPEPSSPSILDEAASVSSSIHSSIPSSIASDADMLLTDQWSLPLNGQTAPLDLLAEMAGLQKGSGTDIESRPKTGAKRAMPQDAGDRPTARELFSEEANGRFGRSPTEQSETVWPIQPSGSVRSSSTSFDSTPQKCHPQDLSSDRGRLSEADLIARGRTEFESPGSRFLPALLSVQRAQAALLPDTGGSEKRDVRNEALGAEDDLTLLAAKMKRILDEEARRHGIDV